MKMNLKQNVNIKTCQSECNSYRTCRKDYSLNPNTLICDTNKYLKSTSVTECVELITVMDTVSAKKTIATTITSNTFSLYKTKRLLYFEHNFISNHITIGNYYYLLPLCKTKRHNIKWKITNFKKFVLKIVRVLISMI